MARIHWILGPVGAGKSTYALRLARERAALRLDLDAWMAALFRADRPEEGVMPWYVERAARCVDQIWRVALGALEIDRDVVLEIGMIQRRDRAGLLPRIDASGYPLTIHVIDAPRALRRARVLGRNEAQGATFSMIVPPAVFELASDLWEPLDDDERRGREVVEIDGGEGELGALIAAQAADLA
ncbi:MAG: ATP-binding protein [Myxococcales bacterium]|nr:ATP-binding protein [Myxococcales bacterium]MCB9704100.1 ATP-binding protein [Myxococcales bacterium]